MVILCAALQDLVGILLSSLLNTTRKHILLSLSVQNFHLLIRLVFLLPLHLKVLDSAMQMLLTGLQLYITKSAKHLSSPKHSCQQTINPRNQLIVLLRSLPYHIVQMRPQNAILLLQTPRKIILIRHLLRHLIRPELQPSTSAFDNDRWAETAEDAGLVVFAGMEGSHDCVVWVEEIRLAGGAFALVVSGSCEFEAVGAW